MGNLTKRQEKILKTLIDEYTKNAEPVSSNLLAKKRGFNVCSATIRNEMQKLTDMGYIYKSHISSGRTPTVMAYRFFVNGLFNFSSDKTEDFVGAEQSIFDNFFNDFHRLEKKTINEIKFIEMLTKNLAEESSNLVLTYLFKNDFVLKEGWEDVFQNPEFKEKSYLDKFIKEVELLEKNIKKFVQDDNFQKINVYIGSKKPLLKSEDFSLIITQGKFPNNERGVIAILGPRRMEYEKNIGLMQSLTKLLKSF